MRVRVIAKFVARSHEALPRGQMDLKLVANDEEGRVDARCRERIEDVIKRRASRPIVEGERDDGLQSFHSGHEIAEELEAPRPDNRSEARENHDDADHDRDEPRNRSIHAVTLNLADLTGCGSPAAAATRWRNLATFLRGRRQVQPLVSRGDPA